MIINFSNSEKSEFTADVCVIGSGAAGFACAISLLESGFNVIILEGGDSVYNQKSASLHNAELKGKFHGGIHNARERIVGGTTTTWGGQALPFMQEDFESRPHVPLSGWPLSFEDLKPYYLKAETILGTDVSVPFSYRPWNDWSIKEPVIDTSKLDFIITKWCKIPNFAVQHGEKVKQSQSVVLLKNANALEFIPDKNENIKSISISSLNNKKGIVKAKYFISAGGAFETVRLFLNSRKFSPEGIANRNGLVGHYIQDHVAAIVGQIIPTSRDEFHDVFDPFYKDGFKYLTRLRLSPNLAEKEDLLHASAQIVFDVNTNNVLVKAKKAFADLKSKRKNYNKLFSLFLSYSNFSELLKIIYRWKFLKRGTSPKNGPIWLEIHSEQEPDFSNSIKVDENKDILGQHRISLDWNVSESTIKTIKEMAKYTASELENSGIAKVRLESWIKTNSGESLKWMTDSYHQAGGLRMGKNEVEGVVDSNCKVFGIDNLYVASSAVYPTSSFSNPTMTTIALAIRISEHIEKRLKEK